MAQRRHRAWGAPAAAGLCLAAVVLLYHIPLSDSVAADALHACLAGLAALACRWMWDGKRACETTDASRDNRKATAGATTARHSGAAHVKPGRAQSSDRATGWTCALALLCLAASVASAIVPLATSSGMHHGGLVADLPSCAATLGIIALSCVGTAMWEETLFRCLAMEAVAGALTTPGPRRLQAALICSAAFALFHLGSAADAATEALRAVQVVLFGLAMAGLVERTGSLAGAVVTHALYDMACFAPAALGMAGSTWDMPAETLSALETSMPGLVASLAFLVPAGMLGLGAFAGQARRS